MKSEEQYIIIILVCILFFYYIIKMINHEKYTKYINNINNTNHTNNITNVNLKSNNARYKLHPQLKEGFQNLINNKKATFTLFYSKTCSHCIDLIPIWEQLKSMNKKNDYLTFKELESNNDNNDSFIKYNIKYLPTMILQFENKSDFTVYKGDRTLHDIIKFIRLNGLIIEQYNNISIESFANKNSGNTKFDFEKGIFDYNNDTKTYSLETELSKIKFVFNPESKTYDFVIETPDGIKTETIVPNYSESHNPTFGLVSYFIDELKQMKMTKSQIIIELNKLKTKQFIKHLDNGICYDNKIENLKTYYKSKNNNDYDDIEKKLTLIDERVCNSDNYIRQTQT
jgi:thiol-disulfide isomerase/thioredoxin